MVLRKGLGLFLLLGLTSLGLAETIAAPPATGFQKDIAVEADTRIEWQFPVSTAFDFGDVKLGDYNSKKQHYQLYVPPNYHAKKAWPLVVFISPQNKPSAWNFWKKSCEDRHMLYCEAHGAGNGCPPQQRARLILDMLDDVRRHYRIDANQTYLSGFSGGGRMACCLAYALPEYFGGVIPICGTWTLPKLVYLRHRIKDRLSVAFVTGTGDFNRSENENYMSPWFRDIGIRSKLWVVKDTPHAMPPSDVLDRVLQWLIDDLPRRQADVKERPGLAVTVDDALLGGQQAGQQLETAQLESRKPGKVWQAAALAQGVVKRWPTSTSAEVARNFLDRLKNDPDQSGQLAEQRNADERQANIAKAKALEQFGRSVKAMKLWQEMARQYADTPEGEKAEAEAKRLQTSLANAPKKPFLGIRFEENSLTVQRVERENPAGLAGVRAGDVVTKLDSTDLRSLEELTKILEKHKPGDRIAIHVLRGGKPRIFQVELGVAPGLEDGPVPGEG